MKSLSFGGVGSIAIVEIVWRLCFCRAELLMFPMVRYTGQDLLSPEKFVSCVASDIRIIGRSVPASGSKALNSDTTPKLVAFTGTEF